MMRLDRFLCEMQIGTRSQVKVYIRQGLVFVNDVLVKDPDTKIHEFSDKVTFRRQVLQYSRFVYYMLNKPVGVVSATADNKAPTVVSLLGGDWRDDVFPVGRLDKDVTGLVLLTNDGELAHRLLSPKNHVDKVYQVETASCLSAEDIRILEQGVDIGDERLTLPARVELLGERSMLLTIHEGRFHQVKRMLYAVGNEVVSLRRVCFGGVSLDGELGPGEYRRLRPEEVERLRGQKEEAPM